MPALPTAPGVRDLTAYRWTPFLNVTEVRGENLTGATFKLQVRLYRDAPGDALINLHNASAGSEGISVSFATVDGLPVSTITVQIDETTIEALLPFPTGGQAPDGVLELRYDLHITPSGGTKARWLEGKFTIAPGVTQ